MSRDFNRCFNRYDLATAAVLAGFAGLAAFATAQAAAPDVSKVNGAVDVKADRSYGEVSTVNGAIHIEDRAVVGHVHTVNGGMILGAEASAQSLRSINGAISVRNGAHVTGPVSAVNGRIALEPAVGVSGHLSNVNGRISLDAAHAGGGIETVSGSIDIGARSRVEGGIWVKDTRSTGFWEWLFASYRPPPDVVIGPDAIVQGTLRFDHEVKLYVSTRARIGPVQGARAIVFSGGRPPG
ncbi:MAG: hypothetical protein JOZ89_08055 [Gammaproteobacteria bacterium]|nr:hypothetical protein [Gammaproteobacteria bacterium]